MTSEPYSYNPKTRTLLIYTGVSSISLEPFLSLSPPGVDWYTVESGAEEPTGDLPSKSATLVLFDPNVDGLHVSLPSPSPGSPYSSETFPVHTAPSMSMNDPAPAPANALGGVNCSVRMSGSEPERWREEERNAESGEDLEARFMSLVASFARRRFRRKREVSREGMLDREEGGHRMVQLTRPKTYGMRKIVT